MRRRTGTGQKNIRTVEATEGRKIKSQGIGRNAVACSKKQKHIVIEVDRKGGKGSTREHERALESTRECHRFFGSARER